MLARKINQLHNYTWLETYFRQDIFPAYLFSMPLYHAILFLRLKSTLDPLPDCMVNSCTEKLKSWCLNNDWKWNNQIYANQWIGLGFELGLG